MAEARKTRQELLDEVELLRSSLAEAEETLRAIRSGEVDALVASTADGDRVFTLAGAEHPYRVMIEMMNEGAATLSPDGTIFYCNQRFAEIVRTPLEKIIGSSIYQFIEPREEKSFKAYFRNVLTGTGRVESAFRAADGTSVPVLLSLSNFADANGPLSICLVATEIAELREAQQALQKSHDELEMRVNKRTAELTRLNRTLRAMSDSNQAMMRVTNETEYLNEVCRIIVEDCGHAMVWIGYVEDDEGKTVRPVAYAGFDEGYIERLNVTWADTERGHGPTGTAIRTGKPSGCANMLTDPLFAPWRKDALERDYASSMVLPLMAGGRAFGAVTIYSRKTEAFSEDEVKLLTELTDDLAYGITMIRFRIAHTKSQEALRESEERYRSLFNAMTEGFALHEIIYNDRGEPCDYRFLDINPAFERLTGLKRKEVIGRTVYEVLPDNDPYWVNTYGKVALTGEPVHFENYAPALNRHYEVLAYRPAPHRFAVIFMDITQRKQAEEKLKERTVQLETANKELESFSYSVSHDLRAPLRAIDGYARMILRKTGQTFDEDTVRKFKVIRSSAQEMGQLIDDLLTFSRLGRKHTSMSKIDMGALIREVWKELQVINPDRNINLTVKSMPPGYGDRTLIKQVYVNLLSNAVKFTKHRNPAHIEVGGYVDGNEDVYYVKDNGVGFDMQYYDKLFGVFQRLHKPDDFEGTGIGLATVKRIINRHGGRVWAEGKVDEEATFYFSLPSSLTYSETGS